MWHSAAMSAYAACSSHGARTRHISQMRRSVMVVQIRANGHAAVVFCTPRRQRASAPARPGGGELRRPPRHACHSSAPNVRWPSLVHPLHQTARSSRVRTGRPPLFSPPAAAHSSHACSAPTAPCLPTVSRPAPSHPLAAAAVATLCPHAARGAGELWRPPRRACRTSRLSCGVQLWSRR